MPHDRVTIYVNDRLLTAMAGKWAREQKRNGVTIAQPKSAFVRFVMAHYRKASR